MLFPFWILCHELTNCFEKSLVGNNTEVNIVAKQILNASQIAAAFLPSIDNVLCEYNDYFSDYRKHSAGKIVERFKAFHCTSTYATIIPLISLGRYVPVW